MPDSIQKKTSFLKKILGHFPAALPHKGMKDFETFYQSIVDTYELPDGLSYRHAIATAILHLDPQKSHKPKAYFAQTIKKMMANEIAFQMIQNIKEQEATQKLLEKQKAEATAINGEITDGQTEPESGTSGPSEQMVPQT